MKDHTACMRENFRLRDQLIGRCFLTKADSAEEDLNSAKQAYGWIETIKRQGFRALLGGVFLFSSSMPQHIPFDALAVHPTIWQLNTTASDESSETLEATISRPDSLTHEVQHALFSAAQQIKPNPRAEPQAVSVDTPLGDLWDRVRIGLRLPIERQRRIRVEAEWFVRNPDYLERVSKRAAPYLHYIVEEVEKRGMPLEIALLPIVESAYRPVAHSPASAAGLWQIIPATGKRFGLKQNWWYDGRRDVTASTQAALKYLEQLHKRFDGDWLHAIAAYNWGERNVERAIQRNRKAGRPTDFWSLKVPSETRGYVPRLLAVSAIIAKPERFGITLEPIANETYLSRVELDGQIELAIAAKLAGMTTKDLRWLNPGFKRWATDPQGPHYLMLPQSEVAQFNKALTTLPQEQRIAMKRHYIRTGETLSAIARRYETNVITLKQVNNIKGTLIQAGDHILVPASSKFASDEHSLTS